MQQSSGNKPGMLLIQNVATMQGVSLERLMIEGEDSFEVSRRTAEPELTRLNRVGPRTEPFSVACTVLDWTQFRSKDYGHVMVEAGETESEKDKANHTSH